MVGYQMQVPTNEVDLNSHNSSILRVALKTLFRNQNAFHHLLKTKDSQSKLS